MPTPTVSASIPPSDALLPGSTTSIGVRGTNVDLSAELVNASATRLTVAYPLRLPGAKRAHATVLYAELAANGATSGDSPPPRRLSVIGVHQHVFLSIGVRVSCRPGFSLPRWPRPRSKIVVPLAGFATPATYTFSYLFSRPLFGHRMRMCASPGRRS